MSSFYILDEEKVDIDSKANTSFVQDEIAKLKTYERCKEVFLEKTRQEVFDEFEKDILDMTQRHFRAKITKRLFFKILPILEQKLSRDQLRRVLCEFEEELVESDGFDALYAKNDLREMLKSAVDCVLSEVMIDFRKRFEETTRPRLINILEKIFSLQD